jgi:bifunctional UDP-N-acetylglucosamine pyrophosphorylase/glucosamine-1-phosphate N-acetyltransferase
MLLISAMKFVKKLSNKSILKKLAKQGVCVFGKEVYVGGNVTIEKGACLFAPCRIEGDTRICQGAQVLPFSYIKNCQIHANAVVFSSTLEDTVVGENSRVGPYAYLRNNTVIGKNVRVGDFVEIKNSTLGDNTKCAHLSYIGDAEVGASVNIGCGVVFANYDGKVKRTSVVDDGVFVGCNCNIVAPVHIKRGAYIAAGTTVCHDVGEGDLCVGRCRERVISGGGEGRYGNG